MKKKLQSVALLLPVLAVVLGMLWFFPALNRLQVAQGEEGRQQLEDALRKAAVACYAQEGIYPPDIAYLQQHYGVQIDGSRYSVHYEVFAENLMPDITVLEKES